MHDDRGATLVEYVLLLALLVLVAVVALRFFGTSLGDNLSRSGSRISGAVMPVLTAPLRLP